MKNVITKAVAEIVESEDGSEWGSFEAILSTPSLDRDGDTLKSTEWKTPLPDHIVIDADHAMSVAGTVGSAVPAIDDDGNMRIRGTFASTAKGQEMRTLVNEGHIKTMSVAFLEDTSGQKDGKGAVSRELLNGAFVAIPSNRESVVLSSKAFDVLAKAVDDSEEAPEGSAKHDDMVQAIHDAAVHLGGDCATAGDAADGEKSFIVAPKSKVGTKGVDGSLEDLQSRIGSALDATYDSGRAYSYTLATFLDGDSGGTIVYRVYDEDNGGRRTLQRSFTVSDDGSVELGAETTEVELITTTRIAAKSTTADTVTKTVGELTMDEFQAAIAAATTKSSDTTDGDGTPDESPDSSTSDDPATPAPESADSAAAAAASDDTDESADETAELDDRAKAMQARLFVANNSIQE